jgi:hypothetical protein
MLAGILLRLSLLMVGLAGFQFVSGLSEGHELITMLIKSINTSIIALAIFELGIGMGLFLRLTRGDCERKPEQGSSSINLRGIPLLPAMTPQPFDPQAGTLLQKRIISLCDDQPVFS